MSEHIIITILAAVLDLASLILYFFVFMKKRKKNIPIILVFYRLYWMN